MEKISRTGGHIASNLGVVELTIALHTVFSSPKDKLEWDVGHQTYVHNNGPGDELVNIRKWGISASKISESIYDSFNTGHNQLLVCSPGNGQSP